MVRRLASESERHGDRFLQIDSRCPGSNHTSDLKIGI